MKKLAMQWRKKAKHYARRSNRAMKSEPCEVNPNNLMVYYGAYRDEARAETLLECATELDEALKRKKTK